MIYKALFTDEFLSYFRLDDNGKTLVLTDKTGTTRAVRLEEVKTGELIEQKSNGYIVGHTCSNCGKFFFIDDDGKYEYKYCPSCGANMLERRGI